MRWQVDGTDTNDPALVYRVIQAVISSSDESGTINGILLVSATVENHGAVIQCVAGTPTVRSTAVLRVQGM